MLRIFVFLLSAPSRRATTEHPRSVACLLLDLTRESLGLTSGSAAPWTLVSVIPRLKNELRENLLYLLYPATKINAKARVLAGKNEGQTSNPPCLSPSQIDTRRSAVYTSTSDQLVISSRIYASLCRVRAVVATIPCYRVGGFDYTNTHQYQIKYYP